MAALVPTICQSSTTAPLRTVSFNIAQHYASFYGGDNRWWSTEPEYYYCLYATAFPYVFDTNVISTASTYIGRHKQFVQSISEATTINDVSIDAMSFSISDVPVGSFVCFCIIIEDWYDSRNGDSALVGPVIGTEASSSNYFAWHKSSSTSLAPDITVNNLSAISLSQIFEAPATLFSSNTDTAFIQTKVLTYLVV